MLTRWFSSVYSGAGSEIPLSKESKQQPEDGPRRCRRRRSRDSNESVAGRPEQLADVGRSDPALRGLNDYASTGSGPRQSDARDSELLVSVDLARAGYCFDYPLLPFNLRPAVYRLGARLNASIDSFSVTIF